MGYYLLRTGYTAAAAKSMVEHPQNRDEAARKSIESLGGRMHSFFFAFGEFDVVMICEFPDNVTAAALAMAVGSRGVFSKFETTVLMTAAESVEAMKKAKAANYAPPQ